VVRTCAHPGCAMRLRPGNAGSLCFLHGGTPPEGFDPATTALRRACSPGAADDRDRTTPRAPRPRRSRPTRPPGPSPHDVAHARDERVRELLVEAGLLTREGIAQRLGTTAGLARSSLHRLRRDGWVVPAGRQLGRAGNHVLWAPAGPPGSS
jgi:hypothetical protein